MPKQVEIIFRRDHHGEPACLEYSWVPQGQRRTILLDPTQVFNSQKDSIPDDLKPSQVQVYVLNDAPKGSLPSAGNRQFPSGPPRGVVIAAEVKIQGRKVTGTAYYADGSSSQPGDDYALDERSSRCPEPQRES
jgi:hypothetical protein